MTLQADNKKNNNNNNAATRGGKGKEVVHTSITKPSITPQEAVEVKCTLQQCRPPRLYCYPRVRAHSTLLVCLRTMESLGSIWPKRVLRSSLTINNRVLSAVKQAVRTPQKLNNSSIDKKSSVDVDLQLTQCLYPGSQVALVSDSTVSMMDALLRYLCISQGTTVFLPGLLLHPYFYLLQLFDRWMLRVVGYDVDTVTMTADENDIRKKALKLGLLTSSKKKETTSESKGCRPLVLLIGMGGRFLINADRMVHFARHELHALTVELHPVKAITLTSSEESKENRMNMQADMHITCMDAAGEIGGAVAFTIDPLLAQGILSQLQKRSPAATQRQWVMLTRHIAHLLLSDGMSFQFVLQAVQLWSMIAHAIDTATMWMHRGGNTPQEQLQNKEEIEKEEKEKEKEKKKTTKKKVVNQSTITNADKIFEFIMKPRVVEMQIPPISEKNDSNNNNHHSDSSSMSNNTQDLFTFSKPHRAVIIWMMNAALTMQRRVEKECFSLWEFLSYIRNDVEVVSCGEPHTPWNCVMGYSDNIILRVRSPHLAAQALHTAGFDAVAAVTHLWHSGYTFFDEKSNNSNNKNNSDSGKRNNTTNSSNSNSSSISSDSNNNSSSKWKLDSLTLREVVLLPDCPQCEALAQRMLFLPLYPEMKWKNRQKLHRVKATFPSFLFKSPSEKFHQYVLNTPDHHAYRSVEVTALMTSWLQRRGGKEKTFIDPQPLLFWALLGPIPGYLLSKL
ncbi:uncharacterized protein TM35_000083720 [Trypanosoma theileri]|uniref:Uncharacterized protein n=1 Tax=Trypanosoma theileri TaxID=67003 RepID=A0A1X0P0W4_9TRYP|nr:uncharacterized protein TM35_000083720 [Trypanosoma theileri]ORC90574.1 hypothetical protein TM35_000083720 [Trypanosoma theileri]